MRYFCCSDRRRAALIEHPTLNGIDFLEVLDNEAPPGSPRQQTLLVRCLKPLPPLSAANVRIEGGVRIRPVGVVWAAPDNNLPADQGITPAEQAFFGGLPEPDHLLVVRTDTDGDFSTYRLSLVEPAPDPTDLPVPHSAFDRLSSAVDFSFKVECPSDFDCRHEPRCPRPPTEAPEIDYLARDYASFRQLMLDRLAYLLPTWRERNPADLGVALVELLAYVGDHLSYQQDVIATEAYLGTARRRTSVRRHARLVDYLMHDGCNARVWVQVLVDADLVKPAPTLPEPNPPAPLPAGTVLLTRVTRDAIDALDPGAVEPPAEPPPRLTADSLEYRQARLTNPEVFETMHDLDRLFTAHAELHFYTWGGQECCLPTGATRATLRGSLANLQPGDVLIFEEVVGPQTGEPEDADPTHRHAVRLTAVDVEAIDPLGAQLDDPSGQAEVELTQIEWAAEDALPFPLCVSSQTDADHGSLFVEVSVARGNVVLADHGQTILDEPLGTVPTPVLERVPAAVGDRCGEREPLMVPSRYRPRLANGPLTQVGRGSTGLDAAGQPLMLTFDPAAPAAAAFRWELRDVLPAISLDGGGASWQPQRDLLASRRFDRHVVAEVEDDGRATLRFGDDLQGQRPEPGTAFSATYRVGNGLRGNVGAEAIGHLVNPSGPPGVLDPAIVGVRNPLPARGGLEPETIEEVRQRAPSAFLVQERAVTPEDWSEVTLRQPGIQQAAASFRWTGSWRTVFVTVDRLGGAEVDEPHRVDLRRKLERYRLAGNDLEVDGPRPVPLELEMLVCARPDYFRADVRAALLEVLSNRVLPDGRRGLFHPDNFTFGQTIYLSAFYAAAQAVPGVDSVQITAFGPQGSPSEQALEDGELKLGRLEIARLDNDPSFPERGVLKLTVGGGK